MKNQILDIMNKKDYLPLNIDELYNLLNLNSASDFTLLAKTLNQMVDEKLIIYNSKGQFAPLAYFNIAYGIIDVKDAGFAFLDTEYGSIFIPYLSLIHIYVNILRKVLKSSGYSEGWATYTEIFSFELLRGKYSDDFVDYLIFQEEYNAAIYSRIDMGIHYNGWDINELRNFILNFNPNASEEAIRVTSVSYTHL